ncbi:MAG: hypothetical protein ABIH51_03055 [Patescibacteria group bacterium]
MNLRDLNLYFQEIVYHNPSNKKDCVCGVFSYEALNIEETKLGNLYLIGKISNISPKKQKNADFVLNLLSSAIKRDFYSDPNKNTLEALESALQGSNIYLDDFVKKGHKDLIKNLDFTCLAFVKDNIHIGQTGKALAYLFRRGTMTNIARKFINKEKTGQSSKVFSNIASGKLEENDRIFVATEEISEIITSQKVKEMISYPSTEQLYEEIKNKLEQKNNPISCLACLILETRHKPETVIEQEPKLEEKIFGIDLENELKLKVSKIDNKLKEKIKSKFLLNLLEYNAPKYLFMLFLFLALLLSPYLIQKTSYDSKIKNIDNIIKRTNEKIEKSKISLIYQDQFSAKSLLQQANILIANANNIVFDLPNRVKQVSEENIEKVKKDLDLQKNSINNIVNINQLEEIVDLSKNTYSFNPSGILKLKDSLYLYENSSGFLYKMDLETKQPTLIFLSSKDTFKLGAVKDNSIVLLSSPEKIYIYSINDNYNTYLLKPDLQNTFNIKDVAEYNNNLYFLDSENKHILKYSPNETYLNGSIWASDESLINSRSIAIDGNIYVSKENGTIIKFTQGNKIKEFKLNISPEIIKGNQIFTKENMKNLYILDSENKRILAYDKNDDRITQYVSDKFNNLIDLWITDDEKYIYVLDNHLVYKFDI